MLCSNFVLKACSIPAKARTPLVWPRTFHQPSIKLHPWRQAHPRIILAKDVHAHKVPPVRDNISQQRNQMSTLSRRLHFYVGFGFRGRHHTQIRSRGGTRSRWRYTSQQRNPSNSFDPISMDRNSSLKTQHRRTGSNLGSHFSKFLDLGNEKLTRERPIGTCRFSSSRDTLP